VLPGRHISTPTRTRDSESAYVNHDHRHNRYSCSPLFTHLNDPNRSALVIPSAINHVLSPISSCGSMTLATRIQSAAHIFWRDSRGGVKRTYSFSSWYASHSQTFMPYFPAHGYIIAHTIGTKSDSIGRFHPRWTIT
jgi:hypothetical protein